MAKLKYVHDIALTFVHNELKSFNMSLKGLICCRIVTKNPTKFAVFQPKTQKFKLNQILKWCSVGWTAWLRGSVRASLPAIPGLNLTAGKIEPKIYTFLLCLKWPLKVPHGGTSPCMMRHIEKLMLCSLRTKFWLEEKQIKFDVREIFWSFFNAK